MCGRYTLKRKDRIEHHSFDLFGVRWPNLSARYNAAPSQLLPTIAFDEAGKPSGRTMKWGLVPFWDQSDKPKIAPINARVEDVAAKPMFRQSLQKRRCLVAADGFIEWQRLNPDLKIPFHIQLRDGRPFFFAGMYEAGQGGRPDSFAFITTSPNSLMATIHNRMPAILTDAGARRWITPGTITAGEVTDLCGPYDATTMEAWPVSSLINNANNDSPDLVAPVGLEQLPK